MVTHYYICLSTGAFVGQDDIDYTPTITDDITQAVRFDTITEGRDFYNKVLALLRGPWVSSLPANTTCAFRRLTVIGLPATVVERRLGDYNPYHLEKLTTVTPVTRNEAKALVESFKAAHAGISAYFRKCDELLGLNVGSAFSDQLYALHAPHLKLVAQQLGDTSFQWLEWFIWENNWGQRELAAKAHTWPAERPIRTVDDLLSLISDDQKPLLVWSIRNHLQHEVGEVVTASEDPQVVLAEYAVKSNCTYSKLEEAGYTAILSHRVLNGHTPQP